MMVINKDINHSKEDEEEEREKLPINKIPISARMGRGLFFMVFPFTGVGASGSNMFNGSRNKPQMAAVV